MADIKSDPKTYTAPFIKGDWDKAVYVESPHVDNLMTAFLGLGAEFWAMRRRMMVLEAMLAKGKSVDLAALEAYEPTDEQKLLWDAERDDFIKRIFSVFTRETAHQATEVPTGTVAPRSKM
jgi:hypothetical protein